MFGCCVHGRTRARAFGYAVKSNESVGVQPKASPQPSGRWVDFLAFVDALPTTRSSQVLESVPVSVIVRTRIIQIEHSSTYTVYSSLKQTTFHQSMWRETKCKSTVMCQSGVWLASNYIHQVISAPMRQ